MKYNKHTTYKIVWGTDSGADMRALIGLDDSQ